MQDGDFVRVPGVLTHAAVVELVLAELRKFDQDAVIVCGSGVDGDSSPSDARTRAIYLLQK